MQEEEASERTHGSAAVLPAPYHEHRPVQLYDVLVPSFVRAGTDIGPVRFQLLHYIKKRFSVISNLRYMYVVLNIDEIKN